MKRSSKLLILIAVLSALIAVYFFFLREPTDSGDSSDTGSDFVQVFAAPRDSILKIEWTYGGETGAVMRDSADGAWYCDFDFAVNQEKANSLLSAVFSVTASSSFKTDEAPKTYGLNPAAVSVTVTLDDGSQHTLSVGDYNSVADGNYLSCSDSDLIYISSESIVSAFKISVNDLAEAVTAE